jgi:hypothetical protein
MQPFEASLVNASERAAGPISEASRRPGLAGCGASSTWHLQIVGKRDGLSDARRYA